MIPDSRVALTPKNCRELLKEYPNLEIYIQPSKHRSISAQEYSMSGVRIREELNNCDILIGIKEVPVSNLCSNTTYMFFSHTVKMQVHNKDLLKNLLMKKVELIDFECLSDEDGEKLVGFGRHAGIVGAHNALWAWGKRTKSYELKRASETRSVNELMDEYSKLKLTSIKIVLTGTGRAAQGAVEILEGAKIKKVSPKSFLNESFKEAVYTQLTSEDLYENKEGQVFNKLDFYTNPGNYKSRFTPYTKITDVLVNAIYWDQRADRLFEKSAMSETDFNIELVADIACDVNGSVPCTIKSTSISNPVFGYNVKNDIISEAFNKDYIDVMAVENLPNELPRDASNDFGNELVEKVMKVLIEDKTNEMIQKAVITRDGDLTNRYNYLEQFLNS